MSDSRLQTIFAQALDCPTAVERARFVDVTCGTDVALRQQLVVLLQAHEEAGSFFADPFRKPVTSPDETQVVLAERLGDRLGRYKLLEQIGEGGCGVVYLAEQEEPVRRQVALKVIKLGMDTRQVIARFEAERQALALMDHPHIARVLDAGSTESGRPYFVMELVRGLRITEHCDEHKLPTDKRLRLFIQVCQAIQHAHQKGVIHRDIKPSNILVAEHDGAPVLKVIDFGIAKATQGRLTNHTQFTAFEQFIGTPAYMSPEQASLGNSDIDTRSDIYSLGVLLYELLAGRPPFGLEELGAAGLDEIQRMIRTREPLRPSKLVAGFDDKALETVSALRQVEPTRLPRLLLGDLDWIVMRCLEKDRADRYETASEVAAEIERHLKHEPVKAGPPNAFYRLGKAVQRNKLIYASGALVVAALIMGLGVAGWALWRERAARHEMEGARDVARTELAKNEQVIKVILDTIGPAGWQGSEVQQLKPILLDYLAGRGGIEFTNQPAARGDLWIGVANNFANEKEFPRAVAFGQRALDAYRLAFGEYHIKIARAYAHLSRIHRHARDFVAAQTNGVQAVAVARQCDDPETLAVCLGEAGRAFNMDGKPNPAAIPWLREAVQLRRHSVPHLIAYSDVIRQLTQALQALADQGSLKEAQAILKEELQEAPKDTDLLKLQRALAVPR